MCCQSSSTVQCAEADSAALRLLALNDGLAGLLLSGATPLTPPQAEAHLRHAAALECAIHCL